MTVLMSELLQLVRGGRTRKRVVRGLYTDKPNLLVAVMVERMQQRDGSHYLAAKFKALFKGITPPF
ncbi:hypothetical protein [Brevibacillus choshinensis]|uniref:Uncharacterized protein n=1 Tax=Brevibacillus choshinensis TaxID=54911 RepID=A0ABX7FQ96_BRECH|nr:hypothetical protein [Brevibacillus choshinensis]QRG67965.1 hypothetical protein JNE38_01755 [Brevibacillus choshinensis]